MMSNTESRHLSNKNEDSFSICLMTKGYNIGHLDIQCLCGDKLSKFSEISLIDNDVMKTMGGVKIP